MTTLPDDIIGRFNKDGTITFINTKGVDPTSFTYKGKLREPIPHWIIPQVELPPYIVFFPPPRHPYYLEQRKRYYESHNYLCKLSPDKEAIFLYHLQQYQPLKNYTVEGLLPHEKQDV